VDEFCLFVFALKLDIFSYGVNCAPPKQTRKKVCNIQFLYTEEYGIQYELTMKYAIR